MAYESIEEENDMEEGKLAITKKEAQVSIEEKLGEVNPSDDS